MAQTALPGSPAVTQGWTSEQVELLQWAVMRVPSVHTTPPWSETATDRAASLCTPPLPDLGPRGPDGRDRALFCGLVVCNLVLAVRQLGWAVDIRREHDPAGAGLAVTVLAPTPPKRPTTRRNGSGRSIGSCATSAGSTRSRCQS